MKEDWGGETGAFLIFTVKARFDEAFRGNSMGGARPIFSLPAVFSLPSDHAVKAGKFRSCRPA